MTNTMKHLSLLGRMETDGLMLSLTGLFSENELDGACEKVERLELQARLKKNRSSQIQRKLVECGEFADLYHALCTCEIEDDRIEPMLKSADDCHESLTQYPTKQVLEAASLNVPTALTFEYLKYCALPGFVDSKNEEKTERNAGYLVVSHSGGGMLRQGTRKGIRRTPANRGMRAHRIVKGLDISEDVCHGMCP